MFPKRSVMLLAKFSSVFTVCTLPPATCCWLSRAAPEHTVNGKNHAPNVHVKIVSLVLSPPPSSLPTLPPFSVSPPLHHFSSLFSLTLPHALSFPPLSMVCVCALARTRGHYIYIYICVCVCMCVCSRHCYYYYLYSSSTVLLIIRKEKQQQTNTN